MRQKMANWVGLFILFTLFSGCKPSDTPVTPNPHVHEVTGMVVWERYATSASGTVFSWQLITEDHRHYVLKNPPQKIKEKCAMCKFTATMKLRVLSGGESFAPKQFHAEVLEVISLKEKLCDH